jgi:hypothetical protein
MGGPARRQRTSRQAASRATSLRLAAVPVLVSLRNHGHRDHHAVPSCATLRGAGHGRRCNAQFAAGRSSTCPGCTGRRRPCLPPSGWSRRCRGYRRCGTRNGPGHHRDRRGQSTPSRRNPGRHPLRIPGRSRPCCCIHRRWNRSDQSHRRGSRLSCHHRDSHLSCYRRCCHRRGYRLSGRCCQIVRRQGVTRARNFRRRRANRRRFHRP